MQSYYTIDAYIDRTMSIFYLQRSIRSNKNNSNLLQHRKFIFPRIPLCKELFDLIWGLTLSWSGSYKDERI